MPEYIIPAGLMQAIHDYLMSRPMREVEGLVVELRKAADDNRSIDEGTS